MIQQLASGFDSCGRCSAQRQGLGWFGAKAKACFVYYKGLFVRVPYYTML